jgi:hypothetical protein
VIRAFLVLVALSAACDASPTNPVGPAAIAAAKRAIPAASPAPMPAGLSDLTGVWVVAQPGSTLPVGPVLHCDLQQVLVLKQAGEKVTGHRTWFGFAGELPLDAEDEQLEGVIVGGQIVHLQGKTAASDGTSHDVAYQFRFNVTSLHLEGTRNGQPFKAAQLLCPQLGRPEFHPKP